MKNPPRQFTTRRLARALAAASLLTLGHVTAWPQTLPTGLNVAAGQAQLSTVGSQMTVVSSPGAILNWSSFNIGAGHGVRFQQPNASSQVLNRVLGSEASQIFGQLTSNGRVWLLNPERCHLRRQRAHRCRWVREFNLAFERSRLAGRPLQLRRRRRQQRHGGQPR